MPKKNTLLYLDEELVEMAKKHNMNISQIAELALKSRLLPMLSAGERRRLEMILHLDYKKYLEDLKTHRTCFFLRAAVKKIQLKNIGPFDDANFSFTDGLNVICGPTASGKTTIINAILKAMGHSAPDSFEFRLGTVYNQSGFEAPETAFDELFAEKPSEAKEGMGGEIKVDLMPKRSLVVKYKEKEGFESSTPEVGSILLDEPTAVFDDKTKKKFMKWLRKKFDCQIILTTHDKSIAKYADNVIKLEEKKLGQVLEEKVKVEDFEGVKIKVAELMAKEEANRGVVRLDSETMKKAGVREGDVVEIFGLRRTAAIAIRAYPVDVGLHFIRMDGITRSNAGINIGEFVKIRKAENVKEARRVSLAPAEKGVILHTSPKLVKQNIMKRVTTKGDMIVPSPIARKAAGEGDMLLEEFFGRESSFDSFFTPFPAGTKFVVLLTDPAGIVQIGDMTELKMQPKLLPTMKVEESKPQKPKREKPKKKAAKVEPERKEDVTKEVVQKLERPAGKEEKI